MIGEQLTRANIPQPAKKLPSVIPFTILAILILFFFYYFFKQLPKLMSLDLANYDEERMEVHISYFQYMFSKSLVFFVFMSMYLTTKSKLLRILSVSMALVIALSMLQKALVFYIFLCLILNAYLDKKNIPVMRMVMIFVFLISLATLVSYIIYQSDIDITLFAVLRRIFFLPADLTFATMEMADFRHYMFYGGASFKTLFDALGWPSVYLGQETYLYYFGVYIEAATANSPALTSAYADLSYMGVIFAFLLGIYFGLLDSMYRSEGSSQSIYMRAAYVACIICVMKFNVTNIGTALVSEGFLVSSLLLTLFFFSSRTKKLKFSWN
ncbi:hypothetical protein [Acinetobacter sp. c3-l95]|uniref:hypothetical protein n=1 Tax=Acinetobacter sp. c3-l95 TaxID=3342804 RepID=UPI0035BAC9E8